MEYIDIIIKAVLSAVGAGMFAQIIVLSKQMKKRWTADEMTLKALTHDAYFRQARILCNKDFITEDELENENNLYDAYHAQGLNGTGDRLHSIVLEKPVSTNTNFMAKLP